MTGYFGSSLTVDGVQLRNQDGFDDMFLLKFDPNGKASWGASIGGERFGSSQVGMAVAVDGNGNVFVTGQFEDRIRVGGTVLQSESGWPQMFLVKYSPGGAPLWARQSRLASTERYGLVTSLAIAADRNGDVVVTGRFNGNVRFDTLELLSSRRPGVTFDDVFVLKYSSSGTAVWADNWGNVEDSSGHDVAIDAKGNVWVAGEVSWTGRFGGVRPFGFGSRDAFVSNYSSQGVLRWTRVFGGLEDDSAFSIATDSDGNAFVAGLFTGAASFGNTRFIGNGARALFVLKLDENGDILWAENGDGDFQHLRASRWESVVTGPSIAADDAGRIHLAAAVQSRASFAGVSLRPPAGEDLIWLTLLPRPSVPPVVSAQPANQTAVEGARVVFAAAIQSETAVSYQWHFNGRPLTGATNEILVLPMADLSRAGVYQLEARNADGTVLTSEARLTVTQPVWSTVLAGSGRPGFEDGGRAEASFRAPQAVAVEPNGRVLVADSMNHSIRQITPDGVVSTLAGTGTAGLRNGPALSSQFQTPTGLAVSNSGGIYVADSENHCIRKLSDGQVTTVAGNGEACFQDGIGLAARFNFPAAIVVSPDGRLFVADANNHAIRQITPDGQVTTIAGNGLPGLVNGAGLNALFNYPSGLAQLGDGSLIVADERNHQLRLVSPDGNVTTFAGTGAPGHSDGAFKDAMFNRPRGIAVDASGLIFVSESGNRTIRRLGLDQTVTTVVGTGNAGLSGDFSSGTQFSEPAGLAVDAAGNLRLADPGGHRIWTISRGLPRLELRRSADAFVFSWPVSFEGFVLEQTESLSSALWDPVVSQPSQPMISGDRYTTTVQNPGTGFFRLRRP